VKSSGQLRPSLVKLTENPQLSETLDYVIHEGRQVVGRWTPDPDATSDIMLHGPLVAESHWLVVIMMSSNVRIYGTETVHMVWRWCIWYGDGAYNTVKENSSAFCLIRMR